jgi:hypothetical protein
MNLESFKNRPESPTKLQYQQVTFVLAMEESGGKIFHGYVCRFWEKVKVVKEGVLWSTDTTFQEHHKMLCPSEC